MSVQSLARSVVLVFCLALGSPCHSQPPVPKPDWTPWQFLLGDWEGVGGGKPGEGVGAFSFRMDLGDRVLIRRNSADYPAAQGKPASHHEDLMIVRAATGGVGFEADYFDNEGHVIHYQAITGTSEWTFLSPPTASSPGFRLTYTKKGADGLGIEFDVSGPGKTAQFKTYVEASARRK